MKKSRIFYGDTESACRPRQTREIHEQVICLHARAVFIALSFLVVLGLNTFGSPPPVSVTGGISPPTLDTGPDTDTRRGGQGGCDGDGSSCHCRPLSSRVEGAVARLPIRGTVGHKPLPGAQPRLSRYFFCPLPWWGRAVPILARSVPSNSFHDPKTLYRIQ